jgi:hypothetical protein
VPISPLEGRTKFAGADFSTEKSRLKAKLSSEPLSAAEIAATFKQGRKVEKRIAFTLQALARLGHLASSDSGRSFSLRRVA